MSRAVITNRKARQNYFLTDSYECGLALIGAEVKSIRAGQVSFKDTFARISDGEVFIYNLHIPPYDPASYMNEEPDRPRKLLLKKKEIRKIDDKLKQDNLTLIPTRVYINKRGLVKVEIALARGKKLYDKRETIKNRQIKRMIDRTVRKFT